LAQAGKSPLCLLCRVVSQIPLDFNDLLPTCYGLVDDTANYPDMSMMSR